MPWIRRKLRENIVYVRVNSDGAPLAASDGRVEIKYNPTAAATTYRAPLRNLHKTGDPDHDRPVELSASEHEAATDTGKATATRWRGRGGAGKKSSRRAASNSDDGKAAGADRGRPSGTAIVVYTDGACTGNPGPAGIGAVILDGDERREISEYLGFGTNNIAELTAIERALETLVEHRDRPVLVHSDSSYSIGLLTKNWKAKANADLVERLRDLADRFPHLEFIKVKGHAGIPDNERADELARVAITRRG